MVKLSALITWKADNLSNKNFSFWHAIQQTIFKIVNMLSAYAPKWECMEQNGHEKPIFLRHWNFGVCFCNRSQSILTDKVAPPQPPPESLAHSCSWRTAAVGRQTTLCFHQWNIGRWGMQDCRNIYGYLQIENIPTSSKRLKAMLRIILDRERRAEEYPLDRSPTLTSWKFCLYWKEFKWEPSLERRVIANINTFSNNERPGNPTI